MLHTLFHLFTYLLALYGIICIVVSIGNSIEHRIKGPGNNVKLVLVVKNQEETIEGIVRSIYAGNISRYVISSDAKLNIVDMGSTDRTYDILSKLKNDYEFIEVFTKECKDKIFESFE